MKFTILVVTYNPIWEKLKITLESVLRQRFTDYEIVISDDGSKENCFEQIEKYFVQKGFNRYTLVPHEKNQGTVKNLIDGLKHSSGKYVRDFGPGDAFYNENTLQKLYDFMENNQVEACFGLMRGFCMDEAGQIKYTEFPHPFDIEAYRISDSERILKNLVLYRDNASGACTSYTREYYLEYLQKIDGVVTYAEDIFQMQAGLDGRAMKLFPEYVVWYEADTGVSTKKKSKFAELLELDVDRFYEHIWKNYSDNKFVKKQRKVLGLYKIKNLYLRTIIRMFINPHAAVYLVRHFIQMHNGAYSPNTKEDGFLDKEDFRQMIRGE